MTTFKVVCMHIFPNSLPCFIPLHSNMFLLIRQAQQSATAHQRALHSNMFLLIPARISPVITTGSVFTFQYVSINTFVLRLCSVLYISLHSNMFLLIRRHQRCNRRRNHFTFQYVSINTKQQRPGKASYTQLYIPICFY